MTKSPHTCMEKVCDDAVVTPGTVLSNAAARG
jgi:hypothetical protein